MDTVATADALRAVRRLDGIDAHLADARAFAAADAFVVDFKTIKADRLQDAVKGAKRAEVAAENAVEEDGKGEYGDCQRDLPNKQRSGRRAHGGVENDKRDAAS